VPTFRRPPSRRPAASSVVMHHWYGSVVYQWCISRVSKAARGSRMGNRSRAAHRRFRGDTPAFPRGRARPLALVLVVLQRFQRQPRFFRADIAPAPADDSPPRAPATVRSRLDACKPAALAPGYSGHPASFTPARWAVTPYRYWQGGGEPLEHTTVDPGGRTTVF
jgi:hypothetical protein